MLEIDYLYYLRNRGETMLIFPEWIIYVVIGLIILKVLNILNLSWFSIIFFPIVTPLLLVGIMFSWIVLAITVIGVIVFLIGKYAYKLFK